MKPPKEKAKELIEKFKPMCHNVKHTGILNGLATVMNDDIINFYAAKECALIAVDEMIESYEFDMISDMTNQRYIDKINYLDEVKTQILNL
jgi:hypothetical protein